MKISAYMLTFNNARTVEQALAGLGFAAEIVVVDSGSTDQTLEIVRKYTSKIIHHPWPGFREQYQFAQDHCTHDWVLFIDADEEIAPELATELPRTLEANLRLPPEKQVKGYTAHRRTFYLGRWIRHGGWVPDHEIRLYDKHAGSWKGDLHAKVHIDGPVRAFKNFYYHYTYENLADQLRTIDRYSTTAAEDHNRNGRRFSLLRMIFCPAVRFIKEYIVKGGFRDGMPGFIIAVNTMFYIFTRSAKLWEMQRIDPDKAERARQGGP